MINVNWSDLSRNRKTAVNTFSVSQAYLKKLLLNNLLFFWDTTLTAYFCVFYGLPYTVLQTNFMMKVIELMLIFCSLATLSVRGTGVIKPIISQCINQTECVIELDNVGTGERYYHPIEITPTTNLFNNSKL